MYIGDPPINHHPTCCMRCGKPRIVTGLMEACNCIDAYKWPQMPAQQPLDRVTQEGIELQKMTHKLVNSIAPNEESMAKKYPKYYKDVSDISVLDVYGVHKLFEINDPSGAIQHASKKLLLSGVRTGGKSAYDDIREARDTLNRWLELNRPQTS